MISDYATLWKFLIIQFQLVIKDRIRPSNLTLIAGRYSDLTRSRTDLIVENALLRQQLIVLKRQVKRPQLTHLDHIQFILFARCTRFWKQALHIIKPDTLLHWHRELFRFYWRQESKRGQNKPKISPGTIELIRKIAKENHLWGADRIRGELLKLDPGVQTHYSEIHAKSQGVILSKPELGYFHEEPHKRHLGL